MSLIHKKKIVIFTGAGISEESGIKTYIGENGLWKNYSLKQVASLDAWKYKPERVLQFYNERRKEIAKAKPNSAHTKLVQLEKYYDVQIITQNIDDLHERAGSTNVLHLHGEITKSRSCKKADDIFEQYEDIKLGDRCRLNCQIRPHIVMYGEKILNWSQALDLIDRTDYFIVIGTSLNTLPAANLLNYVDKQSIKYIVNPEIDGKTPTGYTVIKEKAIVGVGNLVDNLIYLEKILKK